MLASTGASSSGAAGDDLGRLVGVGVSTVAPRVGAAFVGAAALQGQPHRDLGAAVEAARDREAAGEGRDQREAEPQAGRSTSACGLIPGAGVADDDGEAIGVGVGLDVSGPGSPA